MTSKLGQSHLKSDKGILFTQHTHKNRKLWQNSFPQKIASIWKLGTVRKETKSVSMLKGNSGWDGGGDKIQRDTKL